MSAPTSAPATVEISGADVHTPDDGIVFANSAADAMGLMAISIEQSIAALEGQEGVTGPSIEYLQAMHAEAKRLEASWRQRAARFAAHKAAFDEHINSDTAGTQRGRYGDRTGQHQ